MIRKISIVVLFCLTLLFGSLAARKYLSYYNSREAFHQLAEASVQLSFPEQAADEESIELEAPIVWDEYAPVQIDFKSLREKNPDCIGWLYCEDTPINYPIMQAEDNEVYLHLNFDRKQSDAGCLFMDFRASGDFSDRKTLVYGHNMKDDSMFGSLRGYSQSWRNYYQEHPVMYLMTPSQNYRLDVLVGSLVDSESEIFDDEDQIDWVARLQPTSTFQAEIVPKPDTRILVLSTCSGHGYESRYVIVCGMTPIG